MKSLLGRREVVRAKQGHHHCLRQVELEVGEGGVLLEDGYDAREVVIILEDDRRVIRKGEDRPVIADRPNQLTQEEVRHYREEQRRQRTSLANAHLRQKGLHLAPADELLVVK
eukprot:15477061-Alexandrium_andersonii.AAC.1